MARAVIFDMGGVLVDDVWESLFFDESHGLQSQLAIDRRELELLGIRLWNEFAHRALKEGEAWQQLELDYWSQFVKHFQNCLPHTIDEGWLVAQSERYIRVNLKMRRLLADLIGRGVRVALCSDNTEFWAARQLNALGLQNCIPLEQCVFSCHVGASKQSAGMEMFRRCSDTLEADPCDCVFIDDRRANLDQGQRYGFLGVLAGSEAYVRRSLSQYGFS